MVELFSNPVKIIRCKCNMVFSNKYAFANHLKGWIDKNGHGAIEE